MGNQNDSDVKAVAAEILRYLQAHRGAADTAEGIARWWIARQRLEESVDQVRSALSYLVDEARIKTKVTSSGSTRYMLAERRTQWVGDDDGSEPS
jgi:hypothetical protein